MKVIQELSEKIEEELSDANKYIKCALHYKEEDPKLAQLYFTLSLEEMKHMNMLHEEVKRIIAEYRAKNGEPPAVMLALYNYEHEKHIKRAAKIKAKQESYK